MFNIFTPTGSNPPSVSVGQFYQGGIIGYILQPGDPGYDANVQHGLIISETTPPLVEQAPGEPCWPSGYPWSTQNVGAQPNLTSLSSAIGTGQSNTNTIIAAYSYGGICTYDPAKLCGDYSVNGYSDWYLPSLDELTSIGVNRALFSNWAYGYWTSTQQSQEYAYMVNTSTNAVQTEPKWSDGGGARYFRYRPTRSF